MGYSTRHATSATRIRAPWWLLYSFHFSSLEALASCADALAAAALTVAAPFFSAAPSVAALLASAAVVALSALAWAFSVSCVASPRSRSACRVSAVCMPCTPCACRVHAPCACRVRTKRRYTLSQQLLPLLPPRLPLLLLLLLLHLPLRPLGCLGRRCLGLGRFLGDCRLLRRVLADGTDLGLELLDLVLELALFAKVEDERLLKLLFSPG